MNQAELTRKLSRMDSRQLAAFLAAFEASREYVTTQPTYPGGQVVINVDTALQQPNIIARALTDLAYQRFVADRIFARGTADQVRGGAAVFQRAEAIFPDRTAAEVGVRARWPRSGWTPGDLFAALVHKWGLEVPIADEVRRRNAIDQMARAQRKLANAVVQFVDQQAMLTIINDAAINTYASPGLWSNTATDKILGIATARNAINNVDLGYTADTLIINPAQELQLLVDANVRGALPREVNPNNPLGNSIITGQAVPILGLRQILVTNQIAAGTALLCNAGVIGSIADEEPLADEGYVSYDAGATNAQIPGTPPRIWVKTYREEGTDETIVRGARFPAMWVSEPKAATYMTGL
jgi:hypothetical protein